jgi:UDP-N-acetylglucosamine:LPS N-acetylglucosamine transferase
MVIGGSLGAESINQTIRNLLPGLLKDFQICHVCGKGNVNPEFDKTKGYKQFEYINEELHHIYAMADTVVSRAGATTLFEILSLKKPNLLIPLSKKASRGDQILNAESFQKQGFSSVLMEEQLTEETLEKGIKEVFSNKEKYINAMNIRNSAAAEDILKLIQDCVDL